MAPSRERVTRTAGLVAVCTLLAAGCTSLNSQTNSFNTLEDARRAGAISSGLLPDGLPPGTRDIRTVHVPGSTKRWGLFNFPPGEGEGLKRILAPEDVPLAGQYLEVPGRIEWWPVALRGALDAERIAITGLRAYRTTDQSLVVAVNWKQGRAYYWSAR
jgi:hypothetical protein